MIFFILIIWCEYHFALYQYQTESFHGYFDGDNKDDDCQDNLIILYMNEWTYIPVPYPHACDQESQGENIPPCWKPTVISPKIFQKIFYANY